MWSKKQFIYEIPFQMYHIDFHKIKKIKVWKNSSVSRAQCTLISNQTFWQIGMSQKKSLEAWVTYEADFLIIVIGGFPIEIETQIRLLITFKLLIFII